MLQYLRSSSTTVLSGLIYIRRFMEAIKIDVTDENAKEVLQRKQDGENICQLCVKDAYTRLTNKVFTLPQQGDNDD